MDRDINTIATTAIASGDMATIYKLYTPYLTNICKSFKLKGDVIDDVIQDTMTSLWLTKDRQKVKNASNWIYKIAVNNILVYFDENKKSNTLEFDISDISDALNIGNNSMTIEDTEEAIHIIRMFANSLPTNQKLIFTLKYFNIMTYKEIGELLGICYNTVGITYHIANNKLKEYLSK